MRSGTYVGTSGWNYAHWKQGFYEGLPQRAWLGHCARTFNSVEINATFYRLQRPSTFERWRDETPASFRFALKAHRFLTHNKKLLDPHPSVRLERQHAMPLGNKLTAVLWQLPARFRKDVVRLRTFVDALQRWPDVRHVIEFRHASWFDDQVAEVLTRHRVANCQSDAADWPLWDEVTTDVAYLRLHGHTRTYASAYSAGSLKKWAGRVLALRKQGRRVHVYFDNDAEGAAPRDATRLLAAFGADPNQCGGA
jgi:uncharacterized protein YecE (DUF72 family)